MLSEAWATVEDSDELFNFKPHVVHKPHGLVPVAMACRKPHGCKFWSYFVVISGVWCGGGIVKIEPGRLHPGIQWDMREAWAASLRNGAWDFDDLLKKT